MKKRKGIIISGKKRFSIGTVKLSYSLAIHDWLLILSSYSKSLNINLYGQNVQLTLPTIAYKIILILAQSKGLAQSKHFKVSKCKTCQAVLLEWWFKLHFEIAPLCQPSEVDIEYIKEGGFKWWNWSPVQERRQLKKYDLVKCSDTYIYKEV